MVVFNVFTQLCQATAMASNLTFHNIQAHKDKQETPPLLRKFYFMKDNLSLFHIFNSLVILHYK